MAAWDPFWALPSPSTPGQRGGQWSCFLPAGFSLPHAPTVAASSLAHWSSPAQERKVCGLPVALVRDEKWPGACVATLILTSGETPSFLGTKAPSFPGTSPCQPRGAHPPRVGMPIYGTRAFLFPGAQRQKARPCQGRLTTPSFMGTISFLPWGRSRLAHGRCCSSDRCRSAHSSELSSCPHRSAFSLTPSRTQCRSPFFQAARPALRFWAKRKLTSGVRECPAWLVHYDSSPHVLSQFSSSNEPTSDLGNASV